MDPGRLKENTGSVSYWVTEWETVMLQVRGRRKTREGRRLFEDTRKTWPDFTAEEMVGGLLFNVLREGEDYQGLSHRFLNV